VTRVLRLVQLDDLQDDVCVTLKLLLRQYLVDGVTKLRWKYDVIQVTKKKYFTVLMMTTVIIILKSGIMTLTHWPLLLLQSRDGFTT